MASSLTDVLYSTLTHALLLISVTNNDIKTFIQAWKLQYLYTQY